MKRSWSDKSGREMKNMPIIALRVLDFGTQEKKTGLNRCLNELYLKFFKKTKIICLL